MSDRQNKTMPDVRQFFSNPCYCINARRTASALTFFYDKALEESGLSVSQFSLLWNLDAMDKSNIVGLAKHMGLERTTVVRNLQPLLAEGYIKDAADSNSRNRKLVVTNKGKTALAIAIPLWKKAQKEIYNIIGTEQMQVFKGIMAKLQQVEP